MFHVELAPLGGILGPLKSDLGVFWAKIPLYPYNVNIAKGTTDPRVEFIFPK